MIVSALRWLDAQALTAGGFALGRTDRTESNSTALAIQAAASVGRPRPRAPPRRLRGLQRADGSFNFTAHRRRQPHDRLHGRRRRARRAHDPGRVARHGRRQRVAETCRFLIG